MKPACALTTTMLALLLAPGVALGQFFPVGEDAQPGITITGVGLARVAEPPRLSERSIQRAVDAAHITAVDRALRDARRRAAAIAEAADVGVGEVGDVELLDSSTQFRSATEHCRRPRGGGAPRCRVPAFSLAASTVTFSIQGGATGSDDARQVAAYGTASVPVEPSNPRGNRSIRKAVFAARRAATPGAAVTARRNVQMAARSAGLTLGPIVSISEPGEPYFYDPALGSFAPGEFCGIVRRAIFRRDPETGQRRVVRRVPRRRCLFPRPYSLRLEVTYETR
jgi:hypothetical protein